MSAQQLHPGVIVGYKCVCSEECENRQQDLASMVGALFNMKRKMSFHDPHQVRDERRASIP